MKDREVSRLVVLNIALGLACILSGIFIFWFHGSVGAAPGGVGETASSSLERFAPTSRSPEAVSPTPLSENPSPATSTLTHFVYENDMTLPVSGTCTAPYFVVLIFPASIDYRQDPLGFVFNTAYPCTEGSTFSQTISLAALRLSVGSLYYVVRADEKDSGTWYNPR